MTRTRFLKTAGVISAFAAIILVANVEQLEAGQSA